MKLSSILKKFVKKKVDKVLKENERIFREKSEFMAQENGWEEASNSQKNPFP